MRKIINKKTKEVSYYTQKVSDILTNKKVSYLDRYNALVITNDLDELMRISLVEKHIISRDALKRKNAARKTHTIIGIEK